MFKVYENHLYLAKHNPCPHDFSENQLLLYEGHEVHPLYCVIRMCRLWA